MSTYQQAGPWNPVQPGRPGSRWVAWGDSITAGVDNAKWTDAAQWASLGQLTLIHNAGVAGNTSAQMLARFSTDVAPYNPNVVTILAGTNDTGQSVPLATYAANIQAMVASLTAIGAVPILLTIPPNSSGTPTDRQQQIVAFNAWLRQYAANNRIPLVDIYDLLTDPTNADYLTAYYYDGTHPNPAGMSAVGTLVAQTVANVIPPYRSLVPEDNIDANNLVKNGLFLTGYTSTTTLSADWTTDGTGQTFSVDTSDTTIKGYWQKWSMAVSSLGGIQGADTGVAAVAGHTYALCGLFQFTPSAAGDNMTVDVYALGTAVKLPVFSSLPYAVSKGAIYFEWTAASTDTGYLPQFMVTSSSTGTPSAGIAQIAIYDLTAMGVPPLG